MYTFTLALPILAALSASALPQTAPLTNSSPSNMTITIYTGIGCNDATGISLLSYNLPTLALGGNSTFLSYQLSRDTTHQEQLDFSGPTRGMGSLDGLPEECTLFHETTSPDSNGNTLAANTCYGLLLGPAACVRFFIPG